MTRRERRLAAFAALKREPDGTPWRVLRGILKTRCLGCGGALVTFLEYEGPELRCAMCNRAPEPFSLKVAM